jgi:hypothetical protein
MVLWILNSRSIPAAIPAVKIEPRGYGIQRKLIALREPLHGILGASLTYTALFCGDHRHIFVLV